MKPYDPNLAHDPDQWLALSELERIDIVEDFHKLSDGFGENLRLHATIHAVVENQLALGQPVEAQEAMSRLLQGGLNRHNAIHAMGSVLAEHLFPVLKDPENAPAFNMESYARALANLTAEKWFNDD